MPTYSYTALNDPPGTPIPIGINDAGQIVGVLGFHNFLYSSGSYTTLPDDPFATSGTTVATGINDAGQIVGYYRNAGNPGFYLGFLYSNGTFTTIDDPLSDLNHANGSSTRASGINIAGQIVGSYADDNLQTHGFLYTNGTYTTIDDPLGVHGTSLSGINDDGQIVGTYGDSNFRSHSFLSVTVHSPPSTTIPWLLTGPPKREVSTTRARSSGLTEMETKWTTDSCTAAATTPPSTIFWPFRTRIG